jgi:hypothetical protein
MSRRVQRPVSTDPDHLPRKVSVATQTTYRAAAQLTRFLADRDITTAAEVDRAAVEDWIGSLLESRSAATAHCRGGAAGCRLDGNDWFRRRGGRVRVRR